MRERLGERMTTRGSDPDTDPDTAPDTDTNTDTDTYIDTQTHRHKSLHRRTGFGILKREPFSVLVNVFPLPQSASGSEIAHRGFSCAGKYRPKRRLHTDLLHPCTAAGSTPPVGTFAGGVPHSASRLSSIVEEPGGSCEELELFMGSVG